jgi:hypothetical protein
MTSAAKNVAGKAPVPKKALTKHPTPHPARREASHHLDFAELEPHRDGPGKKGPSTKGPEKKGLGKKGPGKDLRRAYEHLARVSVLTRVTKGDGSLQALTGQLRDLAIGGVESAEHAPEHAKAAAELARAAEHAAFAAVLAKVTGDSIEWTQELDRAWTREFTGLEDEAQLPKEKKAARKKNYVQEDDEADSELRNMLAAFTDAAATARKANNHAQAIECVRGAAALVQAAVHLGYGQ